MNKGDTEVRRGVGDALGWEEEVLVDTSRQLLGSCRSEFGIQPRGSTAAADLRTACKRRYQRSLALPAVPLQGLPQPSVNLTVRVEGAWVLLTRSRCQATILTPASTGPQRAAGGLAWSGLSTDLQGQQSPAWLWPPPLPSLSPSPTQLTRPPLLQGHAGLVPSRATVEIFLSMAPSCRSLPAGLMVEATQGRALGVTSGGSYGRSKHSAPEACLDFIPT